MDTTFKAAQGSDIDILLTLMQEFYQVEHLEFDVAIARNALTDLLNNESLGAIWIVQHQKEAIGYIVLTFGYSLELAGRDAFIDELYVRKNYQGQGIGTKTIEFVEEICRSRGVHALHLEVDRKNTKAQRFYDRVGFKNKGRYLLSKWL